MHQGAVRWRRAGVAMRLGARRRPRRSCMSRVVHFEIQADDVERAKAFYGAAFGWEFQDWSGATGSAYWGIVSGPEDEPGINGGLLQ
ncbi:VOC family protein, partial [Oryzihumus sp.]